MALYNLQEVEELRLRYKRERARLVDRFIKILLITVLAACTTGIVIGDLLLNDRIRVIETVITETEVVVVKADAPVMLYEEVALPQSANGSFKTYMDYRTITDESTKQWSLQRLAYTDPQGFRKFSGYYLVAMGSFYSRNVGDRFRITLSSGRIVYVMIGELKSDRHTNATHQFIEKNGNIVEFIVDTKILDSAVASSGSVSALDLQGSIVKIERIVQ